jgi:hypothetical protein
VECEDTDEPATLFDSHRSTPSLHKDKDEDGYDVFYACDDDYGFSPRK